MTTVTLQQRTDGLMDALSAPTVGEYPFQDLRTFDAVVADLGPVPVWDGDMSFEAWCGDAPWPTAVPLGELLPTLFGKVANTKGMDVVQLHRQLANQIQVEAALKAAQAAEFKPEKVPTGRGRGRGRKGGVAK